MKPRVPFETALTGLLASLAVILAIVLIMVNRAHHAVVKAPPYQAAGELATNQNYLQGGALQRNLTGEEKPDEYMIVNTGTMEPSFQQRDYTVHAGAVVSVTLQNNSQMNQVHDWVLVRPGTLESTLNAPRSAVWGWIPDNSNVLAYVPMTAPGQSTSRLFIAPGQPGDYPFLCTFPGHGAQMNGVLHVVR